jgi:hypothetical protein
VVNHDLAAAKLWITCGARRQGDCLPITAGPSQRTALAAAASPAEVCLRAVQLCGNHRKLLMRLRVGGPTKKPRARRARPRGPVRSRLGCKN